MTLPPDAGTGGVFSVHSTIWIDAPREDVWRVLLDFPAYRSWNPFVRCAQLVDAHSKALEDPAPTPSVGAYLLLSPIHLPPTMHDSAVRNPQASLQIITHLDCAHYRVAWSTVSRAGWVLRTRRWQVLSEVDGGTKYETVEVLGGGLAYIIKWLFKSKLDEGFREMAGGLKRRVEEMRDATSTRVFDG